MSYEGAVLRLLESAGAQPGDMIRVSSAGRVLEGVLIPRHELTAADIIVLKLKNGYNVGIKTKEGDEVHLLCRKVRAQPSVPDLRADAEKPTVKLLGTGGTIASYVDYRTGAVHPALTPEQLTGVAPELREICRIDSKVMYSILSEDMTVACWEAIAEETHRALQDRHAGVVIAHGTDTMQFTASALSFMLHDLNAPVVLVGSQRSSDRPSSDARRNLLSAARLAAYGNLGEVAVVMHSTLSDDICAIHRGTRVRKMHASRRDAFRTLNAKPLGTIGPEGIALTEPHRGRGASSPVLRKGMEERVALLYAYPGMHERLLQAAMRDNGVVIAGTGLGHVPSKLVPAIAQYIKAGGCAVMTTQCLGGTVNMNVYSTGRALVKAGVISGADMLPETAYVKLMWVLGQGDRGEEVERMIAMNIAGEISERRGVEGGEPQ
ncbi:MAG: Glu-tRNA(Gln) amidotransferase subunit GatD [Candidatus Thermoplasmatota archaeon]